MTRCRWFPNKQRGAYPTFDSSNFTQGWLDEITKTALLSPEEERELFQRIETGDQKAREEVFEANQRLAVSIAKNFSHPGLEFADIIQEGNVGLLKAIDSFDWRRGCRFTTYAVPKIKQAISTAIRDRGSLIRMSRAAYEKAIFLKKRIEEYKLRYGCAPSTEDLSARYNINPEKIEKILSAEKNIVSFDWLLGNEETFCALDFYLPAQESIDIEKIFRKDLKNIVLEKINYLSQREQLVIRKRFGLNGFREHELAEIGKDIGLCKERVRQIQEEALKKLRAMLYREVSAD